MATNTKQSFHDKWFKNKDLAFTETLREGSDFFTWICTRNNWMDAEGLRKVLQGKKRVLDAGCGNGRVSALLREHSDPSCTEIVGIDLVAAPIAATNCSNYANMQFFTKNLLESMSDLGKFDYIYCQEVLHHTDDPQKAFLNLCTLLTPALHGGGDIAIYVYKKKAPIREFTDDFVRKEIVELPYEEAMSHCRDITALGKALAEAQVSVQVPAVPVLGIEAGKFDVQRLLYHFFAKMYWNPDISFEQNAVINYDWYHPQTCSRHTLEEVLGWFGDAGLAVTHHCVDHYGVTVHGTNRV